MIDMGLVEKIVRWISRVAVRCSAVCCSVLQSLIDMKLFEKTVKWSNVTASDMLATRKPAVSTTVCDPRADTVALVCPLT